MYIGKKRGHKISPCGTPKKTGKKIKLENVYLLYSIFFFLFFFWLVILYITQSLKYKFFKFQTIHFFESFEKKNFLYCTFIYKRELELYY